MGLGAPKRRNKLSYDPNNTAWSRSTSNFGHRILAQQGWQPGQYLGAENANHSDHYTAANASHIRVLLREDNLGLGAKVGGNKAETFGLSLFSGVLGRLNGKSDEQVQKQQDALRDAELRQYQVGKYGLMNFVSGGLLVGDKIEKPGNNALSRNIGAKNSGSAADTNMKKRKATDGSEAAASDANTKKRKTQADGTGSSTEQQLAEEDETAERARRKEKEKEKKKKAKRTAEQHDSMEASDSALVDKKSKKRGKGSPQDDTSSTGRPSKEEKARLKQEKRARKEDCRKRKEARRLERAREQGSTASEGLEARKPATAAAATTTPFTGGRHSVRHRYIQQKRMAGRDAQAMKEIFMIKAAA